MCERLPGYDDWKLDNGPYVNDGEPDELPDADERLARRRKRFPGELYPDGTVIDPEAYGVER